MSQITPEMRTKIRELRGAPITVLFVLLLLGGRAGNKQLAMITGYSLPTVRDALEKLRDAVLVTRLDRYKGWVLTHGGQQLALVLSEKNFHSLEAGGSEKNFHSSAGSEKNFHSSEKNFHSRPTTTTVKDSLNTESVAVAGQTSEKNFHSQDPDPQVLEVLKAAGIGEPTLSRLARLEHVTLEYVQAHVARSRREGKGTGLLVHRIRSGDPAPVDPPAPGSEEDRRKYVEGPYSDFIEH